MAATIHDKPIKKNMAALKKNILQATGPSDAQERLHKAQELIDDALDAPTSTKAQALAREALKLSMDCSDAYTLLAGYAKTDAEALALLRMAVETGERAINKQDLLDMAGELWLLLEARPYMRALEQTALCYEGMGNYAEAAARYEQLLDMNHEDNQGVRYLLLSVLILLDQDEKAEALYARYQDDAYADWAYGRLLLDFRRHGGDSEITSQSLKKAMGCNAYVVACLLGSKSSTIKKATVISADDEYDWEEALDYVDRVRPAWKHTLGLLTWLKQQAG